MKNKLLIIYSNIFEQHNSGFGFTLIELLVATLMSSFVVAAAGYGLVSMLEVNKIEETKTQRQLELNRAMDYLTEEIKMSNSISWASDGLSLNIPSPFTTPLYKTEAVSSGSIWLKDFVLKKNSDVLVDALIAPTTAEITAITNNCTAQSASFHGSNGFYACIYPDADPLKPKRKVDLYLYGKIDQNNYFQVKTTAFARSK